MDSPWTLRLGRIASRALPGLLHEFATPLSIIRNDAQFLRQAVQQGLLPPPDEMLEVASEVEAASDRLEVILAALKTLPLAAEQGRDFVPVCNSVLTVLHNHWKYAWTVESRWEVLPALPCAEAWAWVAWAETLQLVAATFAGGRLSLSSAAGQPSLLVRIDLAAEDSGHGRDFLAGWRILLDSGPIVGTWEQTTPRTWSASLWFQGSPQW